MLQVVACVDGSRAAPAVCDYAAWASRHVGRPCCCCTFWTRPGIRWSRTWLAALAWAVASSCCMSWPSWTGRRAKLALEHGHHLLEEAERRVRAAGVEAVTRRQRHDSLPESLLALEDQARLLVMGLHGESSSGADNHVGSQLETVIRSVHRPILLVPDEYTPPRSAMFAFDGSATGFRAVELLAASPLLKGLPLHLVMVGPDTGDRREQLQQARTRLSDWQAELTLAIRPGDVEPTLHAYQEEHDIDLLVMGAYGHSRLRQFLLGSTTTTMLQTATRPLVILR